jgi:hypothetical protein
MRVLCRCVGTSETSGCHDEKERACEGNTLHVATHGAAMAQISMPAHVFWKNPTRNFETQQVVVERGCVRFEKNT